MTQNPPPVEVQIADFLEDTTVGSTVRNLLAAALGRIIVLKERVDGLLEANNRYQQDARDAKAACESVERAITDPENQPSQWGTILDDKAFQAKVGPWLVACFGEEIARDRVERNHRFLEEALELVQAAGASREEAFQLVDYVFDRPTGEIGQEIGGVMVTLAALCLALGREMHVEAEIELARIWQKVDAIRAKRQTKPRFGPLPGHVALIRHRKRGTVYRVIGDGHAQTSRPLGDNDVVVVYRGLADGRLWVRPIEEATHDRFEEVK